MSKKLHIELTSNFGMISKNTADAAFNRIKRRDRQAIHYQKGGWDGRIYHLYIQVSCDSADVNSMMRDFIGGYDYLKFHMTVRG